MRATLALLLLAACGGAQPEVATPEAPAPDATATSTLEGVVYGQGVHLTESTPISTLLAEAEAWDGKVVRVEGTVTEVCEKRGCWMTIASDQPFQDLRFKVEDGVITIPLDAKGRYAVAEGTVRRVDLSPEDARAMREHEAEEQGKAVDESAPLPTHVVKLEGTGAVIRDRA